MRTLIARAVLIAILVVPASASAQAREIVPDVVYGHKDGMALTFDVFKPASPNGAGVLFMISGGWVSTWRAPQQAQAGYASFLEAGITVFAVRHGSSPRYNVAEAVNDVTLANRFIHEHASEWGVDPNRLGVTGGSAGGHLSLVLGNQSVDGERMAAVVAYFPPVDLRPLRGPSERFPALDYPEEDATRISPIAHVSADDPPTLLIHGTADTLVPISNSERAHAAFQAAGVESSYIILEGAGHGFRGEQAQQANAARLKWFVDHLVH